MMCSASAGVQGRHFQLRLARAVFLSWLLWRHRGREFGLESEFLAVQVEDDGDGH